MPERSSSENGGIFWCISIRAKISGGNVDEEDGHYLKMGVGCSIIGNWEGGKIEGLVTLVQSNIKLAKPYVCLKILGVY